MTNKLWLSDEDFFNIYSKVPRLNIDLVIEMPVGIVLSKRSIEPNLGCYHLPGGTVYKGELLSEAAVRIAKNETGLDIKTPQCIGYLEFPHEMRQGVDIHTISIVMSAHCSGGDLVKDKNAAEIGIYNTLPSPCIPEHELFLKSHTILV